MKKIIFFVVLVFAFSACQNTEKDGHSHENGTANWSVVDSLHMASMVVGGKYFDPIEEALEGLITAGKENPAALKDISLETVENVLTQVENANQGMNSWMEGHAAARASAQGVSADEAAKIVEKEYQGIQKVTDDTNTAVAAAKELLKTLGLQLDIDLLDAPKEEAHDHSEHDGHEH